MKNSITLLINYSLLIMLLIFFGCCNLPKEKTYVVESENKGWLFDGTVGSGFVMTGSNGISEGFTMYRDQHEFTEGGSGYFFITTEISKRESFHQAFSSTFGHNLSITLSASFPPFGNDLYINLYEIGFAYDLKYNEVSRLDTPFGHKSKTMTDQGYAGYIIIGSTAEILNQVEINAYTYNHVLKFVLQDFSESWTDYTVREMYFAKNYGLVKFVFNNGIEVTRFID